MPGHSGVFLGHTGRDIVTKEDPKENRPLILRRPLRASDGIVNTLLKVAVVALAPALSACGGGSGSDVSPRVETPPQVERLEPVTPEIAISHRFGTYDFGPTEEYIAEYIDPDGFVFEVERVSARVVVEMFGMTSPAHFSFGARINGDTWTDRMPTVHVDNNPALAGTVTWNGFLVGFTPGTMVPALGHPVIGHASISIDFDTFAGRVDFTNLESWAPEVAPEALGTGSTWGDGDLSYIIDVPITTTGLTRGKTFRKTGGDEGELYGGFSGVDHEGVVGTLERQDLKAAFGASR